MRNFFAFILIMNLCVSCAADQTPYKSTVYEQEFYSILNDIIRMKLIDVSVIHQKTKPVYRTVFGKDGFCEDPTSPPPPGIIYYDSRIFDDMIKKGRLDYADAEYMYKSIDSTRIITIDSSRVVIPVLMETQFIRVFRRNRDKGYDVIKNRFGTSCFIQVSTPVFNSSFTKGILSIDYNCGPKGGQGYLFILEKRNGMWWLIEDMGTWIS